MGVLKRIGLGVLMMCFASSAFADDETIEKDETKATEQTKSEVAETTQDESKEGKTAKPVTKEAPDSKEESLERLVLDEKIDGEVNIALPQDI